MTETRHTGVVGVGFLVFRLILAWVKQRCPIPRPDGPTRRQKPDPKDHRCPGFQNMAGTDIVGGERRSE